MCETLIKEDLRFRQLGGGLLLIIAVPLTLVSIFLGFAATVKITDLGFLLPGPALLAAALWAVFPRRAPRTKLTISDAKIHFSASDKTISLNELVQIRAYVPLLAKHTRLVFQTDDQDTQFDVVHLTHQSQDIIKLVSVRLEKQGKSLREGRTEVVGARNGIWTVEEGAPFETETSPDRVTYGRE